MPQPQRIAGALLGLALLGGCGFKPLYATVDGERAVNLQGIRLAYVGGSDVVTPAILDAFDELGGNTSEAEYDLVIEAEENAALVGVLLDATVTRYNYLLTGDYRLVERKTGRQISGTVRTTTAFNLVDSQYSTLIAERNAREKAARDLVERIERDLSLKLFEEREGVAANDRDQGRQPAPIAAPPDPRRVPVSEDDLFLSTELDEN